MAAVSEETTLKEVENEKSSEGLKPANDSTTETADKTGRDNNALFSLRS